MESYQARCLFLVILFGRREGRPGDVERPWRVETRKNVWNLHDILLLILFEMAKYSRTAKCVVALGRTGTDFVEQEFTHSTVSGRSVACGLPCKKKKKFPLV